MLALEQVPLKSYAEIKRQTRQISVVINGVLKKHPSYKLLERESIKRALNSGVFGILQKDAAYYLPHPEVASTCATCQAPATRVEADSEEEREIAQDVKASQRHEAERMAAAKAAKSSEDKRQVRSCRRTKEEVFYPYAGF
ncbi:hypothetical protein R1sor_008882 [Riccia sorocarpa]|uniref:Uncharacterized protein n=1 Tax=Riccia sorocarpa TaxID=122646 RepID=A0ABD3H4G6_9MARC